MLTANPLTNGARQRQSGIRMIEILVALLILSVGLLSMANLQITSTKVTSQAKKQTQALFLAERLVEQMRANPKHLQDYDGTSIGSDTACSKAFTSSASGVTKQIQVWQNDAACQLGSVEGSVTVDSAAESVEVSLSWQDRSAQADQNKTHTLDYQAQL